MVMFMVYRNDLKRYKCGDGSLERGFISFQMG